MCDAAAPMPNGISSAPSSPSSIVSSLVYASPVRSLSTSNLGLTLSNGGKSRQDGGGGRSLFIIAAAAAADHNNINAAALLMVLQSSECTEAIIAKCKSTTLGISQSASLRSTYSLVCRCSSPIPSNVHLLACRRLQQSN